MKSRKQFFIAGIKSGLITGLLGATFFSVSMTIYGIFLARDIREIINILFFLPFAVPIGLFLGCITGIIFSIIAYKSSTFLRNLKPIAIVSCAIACSFYPLALLILPFLLQITYDPVEIKEALILLPGGLLGGAVAGLLGSRRFLHYIDNAEEKPIVIVEPQVIGPQN